jgi:hypothetical protein
MLVNHHTKYKEIHGKDEIVLMEKGEHAALHYRLRKCGKCTVPVKQLFKISMTAQRREIKKKQTRFVFRTTMSKNIRLREDWILNDSGILCIAARFEPNHKAKIYTINEEKE